MVEQHDGLLEACRVGDCGIWDPADLNHCDTSSANACACIEHKKEAGRVPQAVSPWISSDDFNALKPFTRSDYMINGTVSFALFWLNFVIIFLVAICIFHIKKVPRDAKIADTEHVDESTSVSSIDALQKKLQAESEREKKILRSVTTLHEIKSTGHTTKRNNRRITHSHVYTDKLYELYGKPVGRRGAGKKPKPTSRNKGRKVVKVQPTASSNKYFQSQYYPTPAAGDV